MRRAMGIAAAIALTLVAGSAAADETTPTRQEVRQAQQAARDAERNVAAVQADLVLANQRLQESAMRAAQAAEAWNGARYQLQLARGEAQEAQRRSEVARADVERQRSAYADSIASSYQSAPGITGLGSLANADGIEDVIEDVTTMQSAEAALDRRYDGFRASSTLADVASEQAEKAQDKAMALQVEAREARDAASAAADAAAADASAIAAEKDALIGELARLQDISVRLAERRQSALEQEAAEAAAAAAQAAAEQAAEQAAQEQAQQDAAADQSSQEQNDPAPQDDATQEPDPQPDPPSTPTPPTPPTPPSPPSSGNAGAAIGFARAQIGEPYRWGAAGPSSWDCSGLTMGAWRAGGKYLPHYSVAQYQQSTPISPGSLRPGDLLFWGSSSSSSSIYHVALYVGGGQMIHAPRTGRPVTQESMYYWIPPNFYARP